MTRKLRCLLLIILAVPAGIFVFVTVGLVIVHRAQGVEFSYEHNGTDLTFASSDGGWRAEEDMLKGKDFEKLLVEFELYRLRSGQPDVRLLRTKAWKKPWKWAWWFDHAESTKWKVPYVPADAVPRDSGVRSLSGEVSSAELLASRQAAADYLLGLQ